MRTALCLLAILAVSPAAALAQVTATLDPPEIVLGESAQLSLTVTGSGSVGDPPLPAVDGLRFQRAGRSTNMQITNGRMTSSIGLLFDVTPQRAGSFTIPAIAVPGVGASAPVTLLVRAGPDGAREARPGTDPLVLEVVVPRSQLFVGELVGVELRLRVRDGTRVSEVGRPALSGSAFTVTGPVADARPQQTQTVIDGVRYTVVTWPAAVSPVKPGVQQLDARLEAVVAVPSSRRRQGGGNDPFFDGFFGGFFGGSQLQKVELTSPATRIDVLALPDEGRPPDFGGAVGQFRLAATAAPTQVAAGDPVTLRIAIEGTGNFDRVTSPILPPDAGWRAYPPSVTFEPGTPLGTTGTKRFEAALVPERTGAITIPALRFGYFDPEARRYEQLASTPIAVTVTGTPPARQQMPAATAPARSAAEEPAQDLAPNAVVLGPLRPSLRPVFLQPAFAIAAGLVPLAVLLGWLGSRWQRRRASDPARTRALAASRAVREQVRVMDQALARQDGAAMFSAARRAVQASVGRESTVDARAITPAEIDACLDGRHDLAEAVRQILVIADAVTYSGERVDAPALAGWHQRIVETLGRLERET